MEKFDVLILGSGVAGLSTAIRLIENHPTINLAILTKSNLAETATRMAQGGIALVSTGNGDTFEQHVKDTLDAGAWTNDMDVVRFVIHSAEEVYNDLLKWKFQFDKDSDGRESLHKEGGHSFARVFHRKDLSGLELENRLIDRVLNSPQITLLEHFFVVDLLVTQDLYSSSTVVQGVQAYALREEKMVQIPARFCLISTGGCGQVYHQTSNPAVATGDGVAMAWRAKGEVEKMNFMQFHPTGLYLPETGNTQALLTEALRGSGAYIVNDKNERFIFKTHPDGELACRDVVSMAIEQELQASKKESAYLDLRHLDPTYLRENYPGITQILEDQQIDFTKQLIPIKPTAHYQCGGIKVNIYGETTINGLYACGESASTGLHGNNRLASNSLLEALVFSKQVAKHILNQGFERRSAASYKEFVIARATESNAQLNGLKSDLKRVMSKHLGVLSNEPAVLQAMKAIEDIEQQFQRLSLGAFSLEYYELRNLIAVAKLISKHRLDAMKTDKRRSPKTVRF